jgi:hypothetical protein
MTPHLTTEAFADLGAPDLVYVRPVKARDILGATPVDATQGVTLTPEQTLYALHSADGVRLAVLIDRDTAMAAAIAHELAPVSVH